MTTKTALTLKGLRLTHGQSSLSSASYNSLLNYFSGLDAYYAREGYDSSIKWAGEVRDTVYADLDSIHEALIDSSTPGALSLCSSAFQVRPSN